MSGLKIERYLTWTFSRNRDGNTSNTFWFQNCKCHLQYRESWTNRIYGYLSCCLHFDGAEENYEPFGIFCFAKDTKGLFFHMRFTKYAYNGQCIWEYNIDETKNSGCFAANNEITLVLIFESDEKTTLDLKTETGGKIIGEDLPCLSADLGNLLVSGEAADVQLQCGDVTRSAHRSILEARSEVFSAMFRAEMKESISGVIDASSMDASVLDLFLRYMYTGQLLDVANDKLSELYTVSDKYAMSSLKKIIVDLMLKSLSQDNFQCLLTVADLHNDEEFKDDIVKIIVRKPEWLNCEKWFQFSKDYPVLAVEVYQKFCDKACFNKS